MYDVTFMKFQSKIISLTRGRSSRHERTKVLLAALGKKSLLLLKRLQLVAIPLAKINSSTYFDGSETSPLKFEVIVSLDNRCMLTSSVIVLKYLDEL